MPFNPRPESVPWLMEAASISHYYDLCGRVVDFPLICGHDRTTDPLLRNVRLRISPGNQPPSDCGIYC